MKVLLLMLLSCTLVSVDASILSSYDLDESCSFYTRTSNNQNPRPSSIQTGIYLIEKKVSKLTEFKDGSISISDFKGKILNFTAEEVKESLAGRLTKKGDYLIGIYQNQDASEIKVMVYDKGKIFNLINCILTFKKVENKAEKSE